MGSYTITPSAATGGTFTASNYTITYDTGTLTVNPAALTITANNDEQDLRHAEDLQQHRVHGQRPGQRRHDHRRDRDQHRGGGVGGGRDLHHRAQRRDGHWAGSNYTITYVNGTLTVNAAALTITANNDEQDLRHTEDLQQHGVHGQRPGQRRHGHRRDRDQHGVGGDGDGRDLPIVPSAAHGQRA